MYDDEFWNLSSVSSRSGPIDGSTDMKSGHDAYIVSTAFTRLFHGNMNFGHLSQCEIERRT